MDWYRHICSHFVTPLWAKWEKSDYLNHIEYLKKFQYVSPEEIGKVQWEKIKAILDHAYDNCSYYKKLFNSMGLHPNDIARWSDFEQIPLLTKDTIRNNYKDFIAKKSSEKMLHSGMTSGSTGKPLHFVADEKGLQWTRAHIILTQEWAGWELGERKFAVSGVHANEHTQGVRKYLRNKLLDRISLLNTLELDDDSMLAFYKLLKKTHRPFIYGFAHAIYLLAQYLEQLNLTDVHACGIMTGGMVLNNHERVLIEKVFHCGVFNRYGSEEMGAVACECERHEGLHISAGQYYVEILNSDKKAAPGEIGSLIITDLSNYGMPFIRYQIEDMAVGSDSMCSCGRTWPLIKEIIGRTSDFIITPEKKVISGISLTDFFATVPGIIQAQIVQDRIDHLTFKIVKSQEFGDESIQKLKSIEHRFFGKAMRVTYDYVEDIPKEPRGKYRFVKSSIAKDYFHGS